MKIWSLLNNFLTKNRKNILYIFGFLILFLSFSDLSFADRWGGTPTPTPTPSTVETKEAKNGSEIITVLNEIFKAIAVLLTFGTNLIGWFLYPEWTSGKIIGIDGTLKNLWIMVSNIVYFIFAGIFIWIAFMNIIGQDGDTYQLKQAIPRFAVGVIIVPFTWFFVQFVISLSSLLTAAVLSLPMSDEIYNAGTYKNTAKDFEVKICTNGRTTSVGTQKDLAKTKESAGAGSLTGSKNYVVVCNGPTKKKLSEILTGKGIYSIMYFYTFSVMKFDDNGKVFSGDIGEGINDVIALVFKSGFSLLFLIVYAILVIALGMALFVRILRFWFFAMLSPLFGLLFFFKKDGGGEGVIKNFSVKNFIGLALVPVYVSAALAFGIVFLLTADNGIKTSGLIDKDGCINTLPSDSTQDGNFTKICMKGVTGNENSNKVTNGFKGFIGNIGNLLLQVFGIIFLWIGVMAALKSSEITSEVVDPIAKFGGSVGELLKKAPTYAPVFPGGLSAQGLQQVGNTARNYPEKIASDKAQKWMGDRGLFGVEANSADSKILKLLAGSKNGIDTADEAKEFKEAVTSFKNLNEMAKNSNARTVMENYLDHYKIDRKDIKLDTEEGMGKALVKLQNNQDYRTYTGTNALFGNSPISEDWRQAGKLFAGGKASGPETSTLPNTIEESKISSDKAGGNRIFNIYGVSDTEKKTKLPDITVNTGKITSDPKDIKKALDSYKTKDLGEFEELLKSMGITDKEEIKRIYLLLNK